MREVEVEVGNVQVVFAWGRNATTATRSSATWVGTYSSLKRQQGNHQHSPIVNSQNAYLDIVPMIVLLGKIISVISNKVD